MRFRGVLLLVLVIAVAPVLAVGLAQSLVQALVDGVAQLLEAAQASGGLGN